MIPVRGDRQLILNGMFCLVGIPGNVFLMHLLLPILK